MFGVTMSTFSSHVSNVSRTLKRTSSTTSAAISEAEVQTDYCDELSGYAARFVSLLEGGPALLLGSCLHSP